MTAGGQFETTAGKEIAVAKSIAAHKDPAPDDEFSKLKVHFLTSLNHEIRTPLSGILGMTDLLLETSLDGEQREFATATRLCAENLFEILNATLEYSALAAGSVTIEEEEFHIAQTIRSVVIEHILKADDKGLNLYCTLDEHLPEVAVGDAVHLRQVLSHLLSNALKFTTQGDVEVLASAETNPEGGMLLTISVRDTGIGIPKEQMGAIFDSFRQLESGLSRGYAGLGLGLALAQKLVSLMGGTLRGQSIPGVGSTFSFTVGVCLSENDEQEQQSVFSIDGAQANILVVEDNEVAQKVVQHILHRGRYKVDCVCSGQAGIESLRTNAYDLVLMDLQMPGMTGIEAARIIRADATFDHIPILAFTANSSSEFRALSRAAGMQGFVPKPVQSDELLSTVARYLRARESIH
jgi:CheY-like chemotaxis protein/two-component sensor histidine kinase